MCCWLGRAKALNSELLSQCKLCVLQVFPNSAARQPTGLRQQPGAGCPGYVYTHAKSSLFCLLPHLLHRPLFSAQILPQRKKLLRSSTDGETGGYTGIFSRITLTWEAVCPPSVFQAASLKRSPYPVLQASRVDKGLFVTPMSAALFLSSETPLPKPQHTWLSKCQAGSAGGRFLLLPPALPPASSCLKAFLSLLLSRLGDGRQGVVGRTAGSPCFSLASHYQAGESPALQTGLDGFA